MASQISLKWPLGPLDYQPQAVPCGINKLWNFQDDRDRPGSAAPEGCHKRNHPASSSSSKVEFRSGRTAVLTKSFEQLEEKPKDVLGLASSWFWATNWVDNSIHLPKRHSKSSKAAAFHVVGCRYCHLGRPYWLHSAGLMPASSPSCPGLLDSSGASPRPLAPGSQLRRALR